MTDVLLDQAATLPVAFAQLLGTPAVAYDITLGVVDSPTIDDELPTLLTVIVQGAGALETITFDLDGVDFWTATTDANGDLTEELPIEPQTTYGTKTLTATSPTKGSSSVTIDITNLDAGGTADPGIDAAPVLVAGSSGRWVLQDLMPGGIGSWVMPINPTSMTNPHVSKVVNVRSTTAPTTGRRHVSESNLGVVPWTLGGYCPNQDFSDQLNAYADLNRRIYVIDHRGRAWKCAVASLEITPRKRQLEDDGTPQDWAGDYRLVLDLLDQTFLTPS
jgi:hypothetical protein